MKKSTLYFGLVLASGLFSSCGSSSDNISSSSTFDPLEKPGSRSGTSPNIIPDSAGPKYTAGQLLQTVIPNAGFYATKPRGNADATSLLKKGTKVKVVSQDASFVKVELEGGQVGFVSSLHVDEPRENLGRGGLIDVTPGNQKPLPAPSGSSIPLPIEEKIDLSQDTKPYVPANAAQSLPEAAPSGATPAPEKSSVVEAPKTETPNLEAPKIDVPKVETPKSEAAKTETPAPTGKVDVTPDVPKPVKEAVKEATDKVPDLPDPAQ